MKTVLTDVLEVEGYHRCRQLPSGVVIGVMPMFVTCGLFVGIDRTGYSRRYCYEHAADAIAAVDAWDGVGDPPGPWIKEKPSDRLGPGATDDMRIVAR